MESFLVQMFGSLERIIVIGLIVGVVFTFAAEAKGKAK